MVPGLSRAWAKGARETVSNLRSAPARGATWEACRECVPRRGSQAERSWVDRGPPAEAATGVGGEQALGFRQGKSAQPGLPQPVPTQPVPTQPKKHRQGLDCKCTPNDRI